MWPNRRKLQIWSHLLEKSLKENFTFCEVKDAFSGRWISKLFLWPKLSACRKGIDKILFILTIIAHNAFVSVTKMEILSIYQVSGTAQKIKDFCGFGHIYWRNPSWKKTSFFVQWDFCWSYKTVSKI